MKKVPTTTTTKFSSKLAFLSIAGSFGALLMGWLMAGGCGARAVSRKTPIYFILNAVNSNIDNVTLIKINEKISPY